jgi:hypothetical protein
MLSAIYYTGGEEAIGFGGIASMRVEWGQNIPENRQTAGMMSGIREFLPINSCTRMALKPPQGA